jgi:hypothetical protein
MQTVMTLDTATRSSEVPGLLDELARTTTPRRILMLADLAGAEHEAATADVLLRRLGERVMDEDPDVERAVCRALVALAVMRPCGKDRFTLRARHELPLEVVELLHDLDTSIPLRYHLR